jgi:hypothetical protein
MGVENATGGLYTIRLITNGGNVIKKTLIPN